MIAPVLMATLVASTLTRSEACIVVEEDRVRASDLAKAVPEFASIPANQQVAYSPAHGVVRTLTVAELLRLARQHRVHVARAREICVERPMRHVGPDLLLRAMQTELPQATIELADFSRWRVPAGEIIFSRGSIGRRAHADGTVLWKGYVRYGGNRRFAIWAKVRIAIQLTRVIASEALRPGQPIGERQVRRESYTASAPPDSSALELEQVVGRTARRPIAAGAVVAESDLEEAWAIQRGDLVIAVARAGATQVSTTARALSAARRGDRITVRNLRSGKTFSARAENANTVLVDADPGAWTSRAGS